MDIKRTQTTHNKNRNIKKFITVAIVTVAILLTWQAQQNLGQASVERESLLIEVVKQGDLQIAVRGVGVLAPKDERWVAANVDGRVEQILVKAGAQVNEGDLIMVLSNPSLQQLLEETRWQREEMEAQINADHVN